MLNKYVSSNDLVIIVGSGSHGIVSFIIDRFLDMVLPNKMAEV